jgi:type IV pilus assembly protein PilA
MKSEFKTKLIQHILNKKNGEKGFTLIELLVVIIIIGILAAIALPSFLNQASKARQSESKTYVGSLNRAQQAYYLEKQQFGQTLNDLAIGISPNTVNYTYTTGKRNASATLVVKADTAVNSIGTPGVGSAPLKSYVGTVSLSTPTGSTDATTLGALCEQKLPPVNDTNQFADPTGATLTFVLSSTQAPACPTATTGSGTGYSSIN